jgi:hypothetical protein
VRQSLSRVKITTQLLCTFKASNQTQHYQSHKRTYNPISLTPTAKMNELNITKRYRCTHGQCTKLFKRNEHLTRHILTHSGVKPFICSKCPRDFSRLDALQRHQRAFHKPLEHASAPLSPPHSPCEILVYPVGALFELRQAAATEATLEMVPVVSVGSMDDSGSKGEGEIVRCSNGDRLSISSLIC